MLGFQNTLGLIDVEARNTAVHLFEICNVTDLHFLDPPRVQELKAMLLDLEIEELDAQTLDALIEDHFQRRAALQQDEQTYFAQVDELLPPGTDMDISNAASTAVIQADADADGGAEEPPAPEVGPHAILREVVRHASAALPAGGGKPADPDLVQLYSRVHGHARHLTTREVHEVLVAEARLAALTLGDVKRAHSKAMKANLLSPHTSEDAAAARPQGDSPRTKSRLTGVMKRAFLRGGLEGQGSDGYARASALGLDRPTAVEAAAVVECQQEIEENVRRGDLESALFLEWYLCNMRNVDTDTCGGAPLDELHARVWWRNEEGMSRAVHHEVIAEKVARFERTGDIGLYTVYGESH